MSCQAIRGAVLHVLEDPATAGSVNNDSFHYFEDGVLLLEDGYVSAVGDAAALPIPEAATVIDRRGDLILPGFVDTHIHFPQVDMVASYGEQLLDWLERYTFPEEMKFADPAHCAEVADFFLTELLRAGTTTALVFGSVHKESVEALFQGARERDMRLIAGKVLMDRHAPAALCDTAESGYRDSRDLIEAWHGKGRLGYAVTPRFAPSCSSEQMQRAAQLLREYPDVLMHSHLSENLAEIEWAKELFPDSDGYLAVYADHGLLCDRSVFAHCVHLTEQESQQMGKAGAGIAHCPTSNLFLGSGLFDLQNAEAHDIPVGLGTDIGAGTSFSMLQTLNEAYKIAQLQNQRLDPVKALYLATLGGAKTLNLEDKIGNFLPGKEADFCVLDLASTPLLQRRLANTSDILEILFVLMMLGDDRAIRETYIMGKRQHARVG